MEQPTTIDEIVTMLDDSRRAFHAATDSIPDAQANAKPAAASWSVLEIVEHVAKVEDSFYGLLQKAQVLDAPSISRAKESQLASQVKDRSTKVEAPEFVRPQGRFTSLYQALAEFDAGRARMIQFAQQQGQGLYSLHTIHPRRGPMNGVELMTVAANHALRHVEQVKETVAALASK